MYAAREVIQLHTLAVQPAVTFGAGVRPELVCDTATTEIQAMPGSDYVDGAHVALVPCDAELAMQRPLCLAVATRSTHASMYVGTARVALVRCELAMQSCLCFCASHQ